LEGQVSVFISPRNEVAQLYPRALSKKDEMDKACSTNGEKTNVYMLLVETKRMRLLGKPKRRWMCNEMDLGETEWDGMNWVDLAEKKGTVEGFCEDGDELSFSMK
jgi:hypothetical protein